MEVVHVACEKLTEAVVFDTELGWFGLCWSHEDVARVTIGHRSAHAASRKLPSNHLVSLDSITSSQRDLVERLEDFATGDFVKFDDINLNFAHATPFQRRVLMACRRIRWGQTRTYAELANKAGSPRAARAVGTVMANNRFPIVIPCHRVVGSNDRLGGFSAPGGLTLKQRLLNNEDSELRTAL
jgi:methylated-DNA-[protein]-cysteine S-methyltransferase